ncbi:MFS transporter [Nonomuraea sp. NPDC049625]|uniref:MFS transporter n=1 Tax=Nonomuraea sp. NPDC049625 TaxID=3155775 RepID=UPI00342C18A3
MPTAASATAPLRVVRAAAFAVVALTLGGLAHVLAGGSVSLGAALAAFAVSFLPACLLAGRERGPVAIVATLTLAQVALHLLFSATEVVGDAAADMPHTHTGLIPSLGMLIMHGWAIVLTSLWLSRGEALLWSLLRRLAVRLRIVVAFLVDPAGQEPVPTPLPQPATLRTLLLEHELSRRGPPTAICTHAA